MFLRTHSGKSKGVWGIGDQYKEQLICDTFDRVP